MSIYTILFIVFAIFVFTITSITIWFILHPLDDDGPDDGPEPELSPPPPFDFDWHDFNPNNRITSVL